MTCGRSQLTRPGRATHRHSRNPCLGLQLLRQPRRARTEQVWILAHPAESWGMATPTSSACPPPTRTSLFPRYTSRQRVAGAATLGNPHREGERRAGRSTARVKATGTRSWPDSRTARSKTLSSAQAKEKMKMPSSGKGEHRRWNPIRPAGQVMKCSICCSEANFCAECRRNQVQRSAPTECSSFVDTGRLADLVRIHDHLHGCAGSAGPDAPHDGPQAPWAVELRSKHAEHHSASASGHD